jgi:hypothetical protein
MGAKWHVEKEAHTFYWFKILVVMQAVEIEIPSARFRCFEVTRLECLFAWVPLLD